MELFFVVFGVIGTEDAMESREFQSLQEACNWLITNRKPGFWYKLYA